MHLDAAKVRALLPHGPPVLCVDEAPEVEPGVRATCIWRVPTDAFWVEAHFPGQPMLPGAWLLEALAQACALVYLTMPDAVGLPVLVGSDRMRFRKAVLPGEVVTLSAQVTRTGRLWAFDVEAHVAGERVADGAVLAALSSGL